MLLSLGKTSPTRMHSSRMRTVRCSSRLLGGGGCLPGGVCITACTEADIPLWTEWQTGVKTLPCRNFVADGNYTLDVHLMYCRFSFVNYFFYDFTFFSKLFLNTTHSNIHRVIVRNSFNKLLFKRVPIMKSESIMQQQHVHLPFPSM